MEEIDPWKHATFIYACYLVVGFGIGLLTLWIFGNERRQQKRLEELERNSSTSGH
jgi:uncharacterized membrane-anchored protein YhcB (DUF1043 family)